VRSIFNKLDELRLLALSKKSDIIALTETWLTDDITDTEIEIPGYQIFRLDRRSGKKGGGTLVYLKNGIQGLENPELTPVNVDLEVLWISIKLLGSRKVYLGVVYRPPSQNSLLDDLLITNLKNVCQKGEVLIMGDFNASDICWLTLNTNSPLSNFSSKLVKFSLDEFLFQNITFGTCRNSGNRSSCLDLLFTKDDDSVIDLKELPPLGLSDHVTLEWSLIHSRTCAPSKKQRWNYWKADIQAMKDDARRKEWVDLDNPDVDQSWKYFRDYFEDQIQQHCPLTLVRGRKTPGWLTPLIKSQLKKKSRLWKLARQTGLSLHYQRYAQTRNKCKTLIRNSRISFDASILHNAIDNPKRFYAHINSKMKSRSHLPCLRSPSGDDVTDDAGKAGLLSSFFQSVFTLEPPDPITESDVPYTEKLVETLLISEEEVKKQLLLLKPGKSAGPDEIPSVLLNRLANELANPITRIFKKSLESGKLPSDWKTATVIPIYKGGTKHSTNSYRPISLTCICCKILERLIKQFLMSYLEDNALLSASQHGFRSNKSCLSNLLLSLEDWTKVVDDGFIIDTVYIDFKKAFDSVPHQRLLYKLKLYGITGKLLLWLENFIKDRIQRVQVNGSLSNWEKVVSGVPQGSVLGPILFLLYVNDIPARIDCKLLMFADDLKIWQPIKQLGDINLLQKNLDTLQDWSERWLLKFNTSKCMTMRIGRQNSTFPNAYHLNGVNLPIIDKERDLGVIVSNSLKAENQCLRASQKAMSVLRRIKRTFPIITQEAFTKIYPAFVRPHLEYCIQAWRPWLIKDKLLLENVQRRATKLVVGLRDVDFCRREQILGLYPLSYRQTRGDLILAFKIVRNIDCTLNMQDFFSFSDTPNLRGHPWKIKKERNNLLVRQCFFSQRIVGSWNSLPEFVVSSESVNIFKTRLDHHIITSLNTTN
jgi:hypothetical protein